MRKNLSLFAALLLFAACDLAPCRAQLPGPIQLAHGPNATAPTLLPGQIDLTIDTGGVLRILAGGWGTNAGTNLTFASSLPSVTSLNSLTGSLTLSAGIGLAFSTSGAVFSYGLAPLTMSPAGSYTTAAITVDAYGRVTAASSGATPEPALGNPATSGYELVSTSAGVRSWVAPATGTVTSVGLSGGSTGLTVASTPITNSGTMTIGGTLAIASGGTGQTTATGALTALLPSLTGSNGKYLTTDGTNVTWASVMGGSGASYSVTGAGTSACNGVYTASGTMTTVSGTMYPVYTSTTGYVMTYISLDATNAWYMFAPGAAQNDSSDAYHSSGPTPAASAWSDDNGAPSAPTVVLYSGGGSSGAVGADGSIQFAASGALDGDGSNFLYDTTTHSVVIGGGGEFGALTLTSSAPSAVGSSLALRNQGGGSGAAAQLDFFMSESSSTVPGCAIRGTDDGNYSGITSFLAKTPGNASNSLAELMRLTSTGSLLIGTTTGSDMLTVSGVMKAGGYKSSDGTAGTTTVDGTTFKNGLFVGATSGIGTTGATATTPYGEHYTNGVYQSGGDTPIVGETPTGTVNGTNAVFTVAHSTVSGSVAIYYVASGAIGGLRVPSASFSVSGSTITFTTAPPTGGSLIADYRY